MVPGERTGREIEMRGENVRGRDAAFKAIKAAGSGDRLRQAFAEDDARGVDEMDAPIDEVPLAAGFFQAPVHVADLRAVGNFGPRSAPEVPIERGGGGVGGGVFCDGG